MTSPTQLSLNYLRKQGYVVQVVEQTIPHSYIKRDLFNIGDLLAIRQDVNGSLMVQTTSDGARKAHERKIAASPHLSTWLSAGNKFCLHSWGKRSRKTAKGTWTKAKYWRVIEVNY